jgi:asparagine synthase (glutamine-hydrolysing)
MSGIAGLLALDGRPASAPTLRRMLAVLAHRGPDGEGMWASGPVGLGHLALCTTPESRAEAQPWRDAGGDMAIVMDGRIDNRECIESALREHGERPRADHDAELALCAYRCWGERFAGELAGDFALAVWDGRRRLLVCARDPLGVKPFYYQSDGRGLRWGSEPQAVLADPAVPRRANEGMVAEMLAGHLVSLEDTLWHGVRRLPPGHTLVVEAGRLRLFRHWPPPSLAQIREGSDTDYATRLRSVLDTAVRSRLRAAGPVAAHLSGGIDSGSVVALAQRALQSSPGPAAFEAFTQTYPALPDDERPFAEDVAGWTGVKWHALLPAPPAPAYYEAQARRYLDFPDYPNGAAGSLALSRRAGSGSARVMLTGMWGNAFLEGSPEHLADLLRAGRIAEAIRCARSDAAVLPHARLPSLLFEGGVRPLVPPKVRRALSPLLRPFRVPDLVPAAFARRAALLDRLRAPAWTPPLPTYAQRGVWQAATSAWNVHAGEITERGAALLGLEERHPFADRRVVEFCLGLPESQRWRDGVMKFVLRESMRGYLPETVRTKFRQPDLSFLHMEALEAAGGERLFDDLRLAEHGWVDGAHARALYRRAAALLARGDARYAALAGPLWTVHGLELWLRAASGEAPRCR